MRLDKKKPYGEVSGSVEDFPGAKYSQGGAFFSVTGEPIGYIITDEILIGPASVTVAEAVEYSKLHHHRLRKFVEEAGGTYTGKADAIAFLENLNG